MDMLTSLENLWRYFHYILYVFVFITFLPKSFARIKSFADANYKLNRNKYHRCFGSDICCHRLYMDAANTTGTTTTAITTEEKMLLMMTHHNNDSSKQQHHHRNNNVDDDDSSQYKELYTTTNVEELRLKNHLPKPKRQKIPSFPPQPTQKQTQNQNQTQTQTHVNQIAKMFESPNSLTYKKKNKDKKEKREKQQFQNCIDINQPKTKTTNLSTSTSTSTSSSSSLSIKENLDKKSKETLTLTNGNNPIITTTKPISPIPPPPADVYTTPLILNLKSSLEDIFSTLARSAETNNENFNNNICHKFQNPIPVNSIDDILSERRLSRSLSEYSISDLLVSDEN